MRYMLFSLFFIVFYNVYSQPLTILPKDESSKDPALASFVKELKKIINTQDFNGIVKYIHPDIQIGFDGENGIDAFKKEWGPLSNQVKLWPTLKRIIDLGGVFIKEDPQNMFVFPYAYEVDLGHVSDANDLFIVIGKNVNCRENPSLSSKVKGQLSYHVVTRDYSVTDTNDSEWLLVNSLDKKMHGYVHRNFLYSPSDYRLFLKKENGKWLIYMFLVGD